MHKDFGIPAEANERTKFIFHLPLMEYQSPCIRTASIHPNPRLYIEINILWIIRIFDQSGTIFTLDPVNFATMLRWLEYSCSYYQHQILLVRSKRIKLCPLLTL